MDEIKVEETSSSESISFLDESKKEAQQCRVCGAPTWQVNFGAVSCSACKMFFKRNAIFGTVSYRLSVIHPLL